MNTLKKVYHTYRENYGMVIFLTSQRGKVTRGGANEANKQLIGSNTCVAFFCRYFFYFFSFLWPTFFVGCIDFPFKVHHHACIWTSTEYLFAVQVKVRLKTYFEYEIILNIHFDSSTPNLKGNLIVTIKTGALSLEHEFIATSLIFSLLWY